MKNCLIFVASQRKQSLNLRLGRYLHVYLSSSLNVDFLEPETVNLPLLNQDLETDTLVLEQVKTIYQRFHNADGIIIVSPEYNGYFSPFLKNTIDWVSRIPRLLGTETYSSPLAHKPVLLASATPGKSGGLSGLSNTRNLLTLLSADVLIEQISLPLANQAWSESGELLDSELKNLFQQHLDEFVKQVARRGACNANRAHAMPIGRMQCQ